MSGRRLHRTLLEVERKFSNLQVYPLTANSGSPPFRDLQYLGFNKIHDIYFDDQDALSKAGTWVRKRNGQWESKIRQAGDYNDSQFREIQDIEEIQRHIHSITRKSQSASTAFGLSQLADLTTLRETWKADGHFKIVLDRTDFGHLVGEVELEADVTVESGEDAKRYCDTMDGEIVAFMKRYDWAFDSSPPVGKLTAYFRQKS